MQNIIVFDGIIAVMLSNKKIQQIVTALFIRRRKLNISLVFIPQSSFAVPKNNRLNALFYDVNSKQTRVSVSRN